MLGKLRNEIKAIAQYNVQIPLKTIADILEIMGAQEAIDTHEAALDAKEEPCLDEERLEESKDAENEGNAEQEISETSLSAGE